MTHRKRRTYPGYGHARIGVDAALVIDRLDDVEVAMGAARRLWGKLGSKQTDAMVDMRPGQAVANPGVERAYELRVQRSLSLLGLLTDRRDGLWELSPLGAMVKLAGTRITKGQT